jgi:ketosteroid isomerase-like protein
VTTLIRSALNPTWLAAVLVAITCLAGCQAPSTNVQQDESAVRQVFTNYLKSVNAADLALGSEVWLQSADVVAVTPFGRFQGWDQVRDEVYIKFLQQSLTERDLQPSNVSIHTIGDSAWLAFDWAFKGKMATGQPTESKSATDTIGLKRREAAPTSAAA